MDLVNIDFNASSIIINDCIVCININAKNIPKHIAGKILFLNSFPNIINAVVNINSEPYYQNGEYANGIGNVEIVEK